VLLRLASFFEYAKFLYNFVMTNIVNVSVVCYPPFGQDYPPYHNAALQALSHLDVVIEFHWAGDFQVSCSFEDYPEVVSIVTDLNCTTWSVVGDNHVRSKA